MTDRFRLTVIVPGPILGSVLAQLQRRDDVEIDECQLLVVKQPKEKVARKKRVAKSGTIKGFVLNKVAEFAPGTEFGISHITTAARQAGYNQGSVSSQITQLAKAGKLIRTGPRRYKRPIYLPMGDHDNG